MVKQGYMVEAIGEAAMFEQLAEECTELAKEALKMARKIRGENPTPLSYCEIIDNLREETTDVIDCMLELHPIVAYDADIHEDKMKRFEERMANK